MCRVCASSLITERLASGAWQAAPNRRQFIACGVSAGAVAMAGCEAQAANGADMIFRNGAIYPMVAGGSRSTRWRSAAEKSSPQDRPQTSRLSRKPRQKSSTFRAALCSQGSSTHTIIRCSPR